MKQIEDLTAELVQSKMETSYTRLKELYDLKSIEIEKADDKILKLSEKLMDMKQDREKMEEELNGLYESYVVYCRETGLVPSFGGSK